MTAVKEYSKLRAESMIAVNADFRPSRGFAANVDGEGNLDRKSAMLYGCDSRCGKSAIVKVFGRRIPCDGKRLRRDEGVRSEG